MTVEAIKNTNDLEKIIDYLKNYQFKYAVIFQLGIYSGLRISDILKLNINDVENKSAISIREQKTGKNKKFPINENLQKIIADYLLIRKNQWSVDNTEPLFIGKQHCRLDKSAVYRTILKTTKKLGIEGSFGTHTMRKTFGYHHYKQFKDIALLQKIFNHSSPTITLRYIGLEQEEIDKSYINFNYHYNHQELVDECKVNERQLKKYVTSYNDIREGLDYLFYLYKKIDKKLDLLNPHGVTAVK